MLLDRSWCFLFPFGCLLYKLGFIPHEQDCSDNMGYVFPDTSLVNKIDVCFLLTDASQLAKYHNSPEMSSARVVSLDLHCLLLSLLIFCTCKPKVSMVTGVLPGVLFFFNLFFFFLTSEKLDLVCSWSYCCLCWAAKCRNMDWSCGENSSLQPTFWNLQVWARSLWDCCATFGPAGDSRIVLHSNGISEKFLACDVKENEQLCKTDAWMLLHVCWPLKDPLQFTKCMKLAQINKAAFFDNPFVELLLVLHRVGEEF